MVPPCLADELELLVVLPPLVGAVSSLPHPAAPSASTAATPAPSHLFDLTGEHPSWFVALVRGGRLATHSQKPVTDPSPECEKRVKPRRRSGTRSPRACG